MFQKQFFGISMSKSQITRSFQLHRTFYTILISLWISFLFALPALAAKFEVKMESGRLSILLEGKQIQLEDIKNLETTQQFDLYDDLRKVEQDQDTSLELRDEVIRIIGLYEILCHPRIRSDQSEPSSEQTQLSGNKGSQSTVKKGRLSRLLEKF